ncbi:MAG TPA: NAD(P)H-binding protein [Anaerolineales bacterium]|nr:NAD(P)H-binding protein [Anaerolineales bacterium]
MSKILILGATGSLGRHVVQQAVSTNHNVSVLVRTPSKLPADIQKKVVVYKADLAEMSTSALVTVFRTHDAVINTAGYVTQGQIFVDLTDRIVTSLESIQERERPVCWFLAGAALLDMDESGRRGVDLPVLSSTYWPHRVNFDRIRRTTLDWRILCPGPMVARSPVGLDRVRISLDRLPVEVPAFAGLRPEGSSLPFFSDLIREISVPYADAAALMIANITPNGEMSHHRVGLALPDDMRGEKKQWVAQQ